MNTDLLNILKQIIAENGDSILSDHRRVSAFLSDLAHDVPKPQKYALIKCLEHGFVQILKNINETEFTNVKEKLAQRLHEEEGLDLGLCERTLDLLIVVLFEKKKNKLCKNCGKELQEGWKACPYCVTLIDTTKDNLIKHSHVSEDIFIDHRDGKKYKTVKIGTQIWMAENLNYNANGSKCYDDKPENGEKYGRLYNWVAAMKVCPKGWHLPSKEEWDILLNFAGGKKNAEKKLKAKDGWHNNGNGIDNYNFTALPGGYYNFDGNFYSIGDYGIWWSASELDIGNAYYRSIGYYSRGAGWSNGNKMSLFSVRCLQNNCTEYQRYS